MLIEINGNATKYSKNINSKSVVMLHASCFKRHCLKRIGLVS